MVIVIDISQKICIKRGKKFQQANNQRIKQLKQIITATN